MLFRCFWISFKQKFFVRLFYFCFFGRKFRHITLKIDFFQDFLRILVDLRGQEKICWCIKVSETHGGMYLIISDHCGPLVELFLPMKTYFCIKSIIFMRFDWFSTIFRPSYLGVAVTKSHIRAHFLIVYITSELESAIRSNFTPCYDLHLSPWTWPGTAIFPSNQCCQWSSDFQSLISLCLWQLIMHPRACFWHYSHSWTRINPQIASKFIIFRPSWTMNMTARTGDDVKIRWNFIIFGWFISL